MACMAHEKTTDFKSQIAQYVLTGKSPEQVQWAWQSLWDKYKAGPRMEMGWKRDTMRQRLTGEAWQQCKVSS